MPYDDASFDVAISLFVTCNLSSEAFEKHFQELYRVLHLVERPSGKYHIRLASQWAIYKF